jgi:hypothetical protein
MALLKLITLYPNQGTNPEALEDYQSYKAVVDAENMRRTAFNMQIKDEMDEAREEENKIIKKDLANIVTYRRDPPNLGPYPQAYLNIGLNDAKGENKKRVTRRRVTRRRVTRRRRRNKRRTRHRRRRNKK